VLPGVPAVLAAVLAALAGRPGVAQTLVTGNLAPIAGYKVGAFGLDRYLDLELGGYGGVSADRHELVADALRRAAGRFAGPLTPVVVGDTPHDVAGALACGVRAVGVCTGRFTAAELTAAGAHAVLPDLADTDAALAAVLG
jgi:phosphoglycolate phosphatase